MHRCSMHVRLGQLVTKFVGHVDTVWDTNKCIPEQHYVKLLLVWPTSGTPALGVLLCVCVCVCVCVRVRVCACACACACACV